MTGGLAAPFLARAGCAQSDWPKGPLRWVVAFAAGGAADTVARNIGARVSEILGQQVIIDNRTGGNSLVAASAVLQAPRDGQTFLIDAANQVTNPYLIKDLPFDYADDLDAGHPALRLSAGRRGEAGFPGQDDPGIHRRRQGQAGHDQLRHAAGCRHGATWRARNCSAAPASSSSMSPYRGGADAARDIGAGAIDSVIITTSSIRPPLAAARPACWRSPASSARRSSPTCRPSPKAAIPAST